MPKPTAWLIGFLLVVTLGLVPIGLCSVHQSKAAYSAADDYYIIINVSYHLDVTWTTFCDPETMRAYLQARTSRGIDLQRLDWKCEEQKKEAEQEGRL